MKSKDDYAKRLAIGFAMLDGTNFYGALEDDSNGSGLYETHEQFEVEDDEE